MSDESTKSGKELADERVAAMQQMTPEELAASMDGFGEGAHRDAAGDAEAAAMRKEMRRRMN